MSTEALALPSYVYGNVSTNTSPKPKGDTLNNFIKYSKKRITPKVFDYICYKYVLPDSRVKVKVPITSQIWNVWKS